jgi:hypothetical protein
MLPPIFPEDPHAPLATAFGITFWWALGFSLIALIPVSVLAMTERRSHHAALGARRQRRAEPAASSSPVRLAG